MKAIQNYGSFNFRRYGNPWVAKVGSSGKIDFSEKVGGYTGGYNKGEAGELYINNPEENQVYAFGQKDYRGNNGGYEYLQYKNGEFIPVEKTNLIAALNNKSTSCAIGGTGRKKDLKMTKLEIGKDYGIIFGLDAKVGQKMIYNGSDNWTAINGDLQQTDDSPETTTEVINYLYLMPDYKK